MILFISMGRTPHGVRHSVSATRVCVREGFNPYYTYILFVKLFYSISKTACKYYTAKKKKII